jgi:hypothetical protein
MVLAMERVRFLLGISSTLLLATAVQAQVYTCTTATGRKITADRPIPECADREQRELSTTTGRVNILKPKETEAERLAAKEQQKQIERQKEAVLQQQRRDQQLLAHYPDDAALEERRSFLLEDIRKRWAPTLNEQAQIDVRRKEISAAADARRKAGKATDYSSAKEAVQLERRTLQLQPMMEKAQAELDRANADMDAELARLRELRKVAQSAKAVALGQAAPSSMPSLAPSPNKLAAPPSAKPLK